MMANLYRNHRRANEVDPLFKSKEYFMSKMNNNNTPAQNNELMSKAAKCDIQARDLWRDIVYKAEKL